MSRKPPKPQQPEQPDETALAVVFRKTPDGYVVGRAVVSVADIEWLSPTHVRDWQETRPVDMVLKSEKVLDEGGRVVLKPVRTVKGKPVLTTVGKHVVFGELPDSAVQRAKEELQSQVLAELRRSAPQWRHLCAERKRDGLPLWLAQPLGQACVHCGCPTQTKAVKVA